MVEWLSYADVCAYIEDNCLDSYVRQDSKINEGNLVGDFIDHPEAFHKWSVLYEMAIADETARKHELQCMYAKVDYNTRQELKNASIKHTEKMVENTVITHANYKEVLKDYQQAKLRSGLLKAARDAMIHRRDMLIQLGATARAEGAADISIRENAVRDIITKQQ